MKKVAIIHYQGGNTLSVFNALAALHCQPVITNQHHDLEQADAIIIPGVGAAAQAMRDLQALQFDTFLKQTTKPVLGICLGMQLLGSFSKEGNTPLLEVLPDKVIGFSKAVITPHMGWNQVQHLGSPLFRGIPAGSYFYFVHSYFMKVAPHTIATSDYDGNFTAALVSRNYFGTQFHPEKSGDAGMQLLDNFISLI
ncbi:MAG: imidazole glycerol phosphate synthase subunit HisH [Schleiferiaceae bacterium]|nr:imidazole glycerol phosphate synthase subunit HisH [Schleiferiaceae bacterium]